jgi:hypothetical protein
VTGSLGPHSWDGGVSPTGVFWAVRVPNGSAHVDLDRGTASLRVHNLCVFEWFTLVNSILGIDRPVNGVLGIINSLHIEWSGIKTTETANEPANRMRGTFVENSATIALTATTPRSMVTALSNGHGFRFVSDPASTSVNDFALIGHEQNGVYF